MTKDKRYYQANHKGKTVYVEPKSIDDAMILISTMKNKHEKIIADAVEAVVKIGQIISDSKERLQEWERLRIELLIGVHEDERSVSTDDAQSESVDQITTPHI